MNKKVSVIIPAYNSGQFIETAVKSAEDQSAVSQIIVVDDGSTDATSEICDRMVAQNNRIKVIHMENSGVAHARMEGVSNATSEWVFFLDADDIIPKGAIDCLLENLQDSDIVIGNKRVIENCCASDESWNKTDEFIDTDRLIRDLFTNRISQFITGRLFKRSLFNEKEMYIPRQFRMGEDFLLNIMLGIKATKIHLVTDYVYDYYVYQSSVSHSFFRTLSYERSYCEMIRSILERNNLYTHYRKEYIFQTIRALKGCFMAEKGMLDVQDEFVQSVLDSSKTIALSPGWRFFRSIVPLKRVGYLLMRIADAR